MNRFGRCSLLVVAALSLAGLWPPATAADAAAISNAHAVLQTRLDALVRQARPGLLGIAVLDPQSGAEWRVNADRAYPMMSVFKAPLAAAVLARVDRGDISLEQTITLTRAEVSAGSAVPSISAHFRGDSMTFTVRQLLTAAVSESDNTAADALVKLLGRPASVTAFLRAHGIEGMHVDLDEAGIARIFDQLGPGVRPPAGETAAAEAQRLQRGYQAFLADPRNRSTPEAAATFLRKLWRNELLSPASTRYLLGLMEAQTVPNRLRAGLPADMKLADKCGTSSTVDGRTAAYNDIGILTAPDGRRMIVAAFLTDSPATQTERDALFVDLGREVAAALRPRYRPAVADTSALISAVSSTGFGAPVRAAASIARPMVSVVSTTVGSR